MTQADIEDSAVASGASKLRMPTEREAWPKFESRRVVDASGDDYDIAREELRRYAADKLIVWPSRPIFFLCDVHADADAFRHSLSATGGVAVHADKRLELTDEGRAGVFVIGGDCFDKGPSNLDLLDALRALIDAGAEVDILAGNHDVRLLLGLAYIGRVEPKLAHLFVRMGKKAVPLFLEILARYFRDAPPPSSRMDDEALREYLFPPDSWYVDFPEVAAPLIRQNKIEHEIKRIREKTRELGVACEAAGITLEQVYGAAIKARELFYDKGGEYAWFFDRMRMARREGSFLFIHAGVDDTVAEILRDGGVDGLNREFRRLMTENLFELYHGPIGNAFRTKYRVTDRPLTDDGVMDMRQAGLYVIVHGHRNVLRGPRMFMRNDILNIECDSSLDRNTRRIEGLEGPGAAATVFRPDGTLDATSTDYAYIKQLDAKRVLERLTFVPPATERKPMSETTKEEDKKSQKNEKADVKFESMMPLEEAVSYFEAIVAGLKKGSVHFKQGEQDAHLNPPAHLMVSVRASRKKDRERISFELDWHPTGDSDLTISAE